MPEPQRAPLSRDAIYACDAFRDLLPETADEVLRRMQERRWTAGEVMIRQGDPGDSVLVVAEGAARVEVHDGPGPARRIADFVPGDLVGEMALVLREPRSADVIAETDIVAYALSAEDFEAIASRHPDLGLVLTRVVADRLGASASDGLSGKSVDRYRILRCVGRGGMAIVYEAEETAGGRRVALKMMSHRLIYDHAALARFQREADVLETLDHPNIVRIHRRFRAFRTFFIAMELCEGPTLAASVEAAGPVPEPAARAAVGQLSSALSRMHASGVIHRDVTPANVIVAGAGVLKLTDFGLARPIGDAAVVPITERRTVLGTPYYMAPETLSGDEARPGSDVYSLGCVALEALLGRCPFKQTSYAELLEAKRRFTVPPPETIGQGIGPEMHAFLVRALASDPAARACDLSSVARWAAPFLPGAGAPGAHALRGTGAGP